jgi:hypothetical protein
MSCHHEMYHLLHVMAFYSHYERQQWLIGLVSASRLLVTAGAPGSALARVNRHTWPGA